MRLLFVCVKGKLLCHMQKYWSVVIEHWGIDLDDRTQQVPSSQGHEDTDWLEWLDYRCLFPNPAKEGSVASCSDIGVLGVLPGIIGCMQANEALKLIIGLPGILTGKLLCYHAHSGQTTSIAIPNKSKDRREKLKQAEKLTEDYARLCTHPVKEISISDALQRSELYFLDVREPGELPLVDLPNSIQIPLAEIDQKMESLRFDGPVVVFCASGIRSRIAIEKLEQQFSNTFYNLSAGAETLLQHIKSNPWKTKK